MAIRKRVQNKVAVREDSVIRVALRLAISRQGEMLRDLDETSDDDQAELNLGRERIATWERILSQSGELTIKVK